MRRTFENGIWMLAAMVLLASCGDEGGLRRIGASCEASVQCGSGLCRETVCVDPLVFGDGSDPVVAFVTRDNTGTNISILALDADGALVESDASPFATGTGNATEVAFTRDGAHAYVGSGSNGDVPVHALDLAPSDYTPTTNPNLPLTNSSGLKQWDAVVIAPGGAFVYAADAESDGDHIYAYAIDAGDEPGRLRQTAQTVDIFDVTQLDMDPLGRFLLAANRNQDVGILDIAPSGAVDGTFGTTVEMTVPDFVRSARFGADGASIYLLTNDSLHAYVLDRDTRATTEVSGSPFAMAGGRVLEVDPKGRFLYETGGADGAVYLHRINRDTGTVALIDVDGDELNGVTGYLSDFTDLAFGGGGSLLYATGAATASFIVAKDGSLTVANTAAVGGDRIGVLSQ